MGSRIDLNQSDATLRRVPVYLVKPDGTPQTSTSGLTIQYQKPGGSLATKTLTSDGPSGGYYMQLDAGDVDTAGNGWVNISGAGLIQTFVDPVVIDPDLPDISSRLPAALVGGNITAKVMAIDSTVQAAVAGAVWEALLSARRTAGSFGEAVQVIMGLLHCNAMVDTVTDSGTNGLITVWRLRCFDSKAHLDAATLGSSPMETGELYRHTGTSVDELDAGKWSSMKMGRTN